MLIETLDGVSYKDLIGSTAITPLTENASFTATGTDTIPAGTLMVLDAGVATVFEESDGGDGDEGESSSNAANAILANDVTPEESGAEMVVTVYTSGIFNREKIDGADAQEDNLRKVGIYLTSIKG